MIIDKKLLITGVPRIDHQHEKYAILVDEVFELANHGNVSKEDVLSKTKDVLEYAMEHFDDEESLMLAENYPAYEEHRAKHDIFRQKTDALPSSFDEDMDLEEHMITLSMWLIEWFCDQVQTDDLKLAEFIRNK